MKTVKYIGTTSGDAIYRTADMTSYTFEEIHDWTLNLPDNHADELMMTGVFQILS